MVAFEFYDFIRDKQKERLQKEIIPFYMLNFNKFAKENNGHLVLKRTTWADVYCAGIIDYCNYLMETNLLEDFPALQKIVDNVNNHPSIKTYIEKRPTTDC